MDERTREELIAENAELRTALADLENRLSELSAEIEMLRDKLSGGGNGSSAAPFIKPNRQQRREAERAERKKRKQSFGRKRDVATEEVVHVVDHCPDCGKKHEIYGPSHIDALAKSVETDITVRLPIDPTLAALADTGKIESYISAEIRELTKKTGL